jgi:hypothetical protein
MGQLFRRTDNDEIVELELTLDEISERIVAGRITLDDGVEAVRLVGAELARDYGRREKRGRRNLAAWPQVTHQLGCHPDEVSSYREFLRSEGLTGIDVNANGSVSIPTRGLQRKLAAACGMRNNDGGYGETINRPRF